MKKIPEEKEFTREQLQKKINTTRRLMYFLSKASRMPDVVYGKEMFFHTPEGRIRVLAYNMDKDGPLPLYVNIHGGGFTAASAESDDKYMNDIAEKINIKIFNVDYSLAPENPFPKALNECFEVSKFAKEHADELQIDPDRIAIGGHSAGGNLGAAVCIKDAAEGELGIKGLIIDYAPLDLYTDAYLKPSPKGAIPPKAARVADPSYCHKKEDRKNPLVSPVYATTDQLKAFPPTLVITASGDSLCEEGEKFKDLLIEAGVNVTFKRFNAKHGFTHSGGADADKAWGMMTEHLKSCLLG